MERFVTLAIHTYEYALRLKIVLESHGIVVSFENVDIESSNINSGVRVRIRKSDLPLALRIVESGNGSGLVKEEMKLTGVGGNVLIPVDFSSGSMMACRLGFQLAVRLDLHPVLIHAYSSPYFDGYMSYLPECVGDSTDEDVAAVGMTAVARREAETLMREFRQKIRKGVADGFIPEIDFSCDIREGIPEDVVLDYCRVSPPAIVVMATRGKRRKEKDLIGSVTAEVLDSCRVPVFAIPENCSFQSIGSIKRLAYFCNLNQHDIITVDSLMRMFGYPEVDVTLVPVNPRATRDVEKKMEGLTDCLSQNYPAARFISRIFNDDNYREKFENLQVSDNIQLLIVPNKKKNVFSRLFNPGIAHRLLFERDMPLLAIPV